VRLFVRSETAQSAVSQAPSFLQPMAVTPVSALRMVNGQALRVLSCLVDLPAKERAVAMAVTPGQGPAVKVTFPMTPPVHHHRTSKSSGTNVIFVENALTRRARRFIARTDALRFCVASPV